MKGKVDRSKGRVIYNLTRPRPTGRVSNSPIDHIPNSTHLREVKGSGHMNDADLAILAEIRQPTSGNVLDGGRGGRGVVSGE